MTFDRDGAANAGLWVVAIVLAGALGCATPPEPRDEESDMALRWQILCSQDGCLVGSQDWRPGMPSEGSVLRDTAWQELLDRPPSGVAPFLIGRIDSTAATKIHVCPYGYATEGEMAVYALQHLLRVNWFAMESGLNAVSDAKRLRESNRQTAIRMVLADTEARNELKGLFRDVDSR